MINPRHQTQQLVAKPGTPLWNIIVENINWTIKKPIVTCSIKYTKRNSKCRNIPRRERLQNQYYQIWGRPNPYFSWSSRGHNMSENPALIMMKWDIDIDIDWLQHRQFWISHSSYSHKEAWTVQVKPLRKNNNILVIDTLQWLNLILLGMPYKILVSGYRMHP